MSEMIYVGGNLKNGRFYQMVIIWELLPTTR